jgi:hypothetical protein
LGNLSTPKSVQKLQKALHAKAKAEAGYRFYALYDKISREDILVHAYARRGHGPRRSRRAAGVRQFFCEASIASGREESPERCRGGYREEGASIFQGGQGDAIPNKSVMTASAPLEVYC